MKKMIFILSVAFISIVADAQKQTFEVVSYLAPKNWQQQQNDGGLQLSVSDKKTGGYVIAFITKTATSDATASDNFDNDWTKLVKGSVQINGKPIMQPATQANGWDIISGGANYTDASNTGTATLLTATGGGQTISVVLMTNTKQYQGELISFINSFELAKVASTSANKNIAVSGNNVSKQSVVGLWVTNEAETRGFINGHLMYTGGYIRKEYQLNNDGTYTFRIKTWLASNETIYFVYESGTWAMNGNQLTITPKKGKGGWWNKDKKTNDVNKWGSFQKSGDYKLQTVTYNLELKIDNNYGNSIVINTSKSTERDGGRFDESPYRFVYTSRKDSLIDNPPGFKL